MLEALEERRLLSASLSKGFLRVTGTTGNDLITVATKGAKFVVRMHGQPAHGFTAAKVKHIVVDGGDGNDAITILHTIHINGVLFGGNGNDTLQGGSGDDTLDGGAGDDSFVGGLGFDTVSYASRKHSLHVFVDNTARSGESGEHDRIPRNIEAVLAGKGNDRITAAAAVNGVFVNGGKGNDSILGSKFNDTLWGFDGNDTLDGGLGSDDLSGGDDADTVTYASRTENLSLSLDGKFNDGAAGENDKLDDTLDTIIGGSGNDTITGASGTSGWLFVGGAGNDSITAGANADDSIQGGDGNDTLIGGLGNNSIDGGAGNDSIRGGAGNDVLTGGAGADTILGEAGNDTINAKDGTADSVDGGAGTDKATLDSIDTKVSIP